MSKVDYSTPEAQELAHEIFAKLETGDAIDQERGDITTDGFHAFTVGKALVRSDYNGAGAHEFASPAAAVTALDALADGK